MGRAQLELKGKTFGKLTALRRAKVQDSNGKSIMWICRCDCGKKTKMAGSSLPIRGRIGCKQCAKKHKAARIEKMKAIYRNSNKDRMIKMRKKGASLSAIAKEFKLSRQRVYMLTGGKDGTPKRLQKSS